MGWGVVLLFDERLRRLDTVDFSLLGDRQLELKSLVTTVRGTSHFPRKGKPARLFLVIMK